MGLFKKKKEEKIIFKQLNGDYFKYRYEYLKSISKKTAKAFLKDSSELMGAGYKKSAFLIKFKGDVTISNINLFREKITALLNIASSGDVCIFSIESGGGTVTSYGELSYELSRIKKAGITLITTVDQIAASGGYMLAVQGDKIYAAPNAVLGSIGVIVSMPNYSKVLEKIGVKYHNYMAGKNKRPLTPYNEPTKEGEEHIQIELEKVHEMFKETVKNCRPEILDNIEKISEGDTFFGEEALNLKMIDGFTTTNEIVFDLINDEYLVTEIKSNNPQKKTIINKFVSATADEIEKRIKTHFSL
tara:strand:- start:1745 stop:2650 length:906 start_codon:yes stop_codon:yes gene_type:complete